MAISVHVPSQVASIPDIKREQLAQSQLLPYVVPLTDMRVHDAIQTNLPGTAASDDLGIIGTAFGTASPVLQAGDLKAAGPTTRYARFLTRLPAEYADSGETIQVVIHAGMVTTVADTSCTVGLQCYKSDQEAGIGSDLVVEAAQDINSLTHADITFTITPTGLVAGDVLDLRIAIACNDAATGTAVIPQIGNVELRCDVRG